MKARMPAWPSVALLTALLAFSSAAALPGPPTEVQRATEIASAHAERHGLASSLGEPLVLTSEGDTTWVQVHSSSSSCPGDPNLGHGGEATGGPGPLETWCFEAGPGDSCGTASPWNASCFDHVDVRALPSEAMGINYWHLDTHRTDQRAYCGSYALWCGSGPSWQGQPVECGTWQHAPGYGNWWECIVELALPTGFLTAGGCTLYFDPRYDTECKYDYFYVEFWNGTAWVTAATFNATSDNPGSPCAGTSNPDYFGNTDVARFTNCDWQTRATPCEPAFKQVIPPGSLIVTYGPKFRWRVWCDWMVSDADGMLDTDGAAFIDNVWVRGDVGSAYTEDFEDGVWDSLAGRGWSLANPAGKVDGWHARHDPDPPYEGGDGSARPECVVDSSWVWRARPEVGYPTGAAWRCGWYYRLTSPRVPVTNTGCVVQYDQYVCIQDWLCMAYNSKVRFFDTDYARWCPWIDIDGSAGLYGGCFYWFRNEEEDVSAHYGPEADSMQFAWDFISYLGAGWDPAVCCPSKGMHGLDNLIDNVSIGFFDDSETRFSARPIDLLHDSFFDSICGYNSFFDAYNAATVALYSRNVPPPPALPADQQFNVDVTDLDGLAAVELKASTNGGGTWITKPMVLNTPADPGNPALGGTYNATVDHTDFGHALAWPRGTEVWYCVLAEDDLGNLGYFPATADPAHARHTGTGADYYEFAILPVAPGPGEVPRLLLVDGYGGRTNDWSPCLGDLDNVKALEDIYEETLTDAGYCYDKFDILGAGNSVHIHPVWLDSYDAVVWFTGPHLEKYLFDKEAQVAVRDYMGQGGRVLFCGDRIAYNLWELGADSLGGEFLMGVMGCEFTQPMESVFEKPYLYMEATESINVFGSPVAVDLDSVLVYRECPDAKAMDYVLTMPAPMAGYWAYQLLDVTNPSYVFEADGAIYTEYQGIAQADTGQCVYLNFDLSAVVNHTRGYCSGDAPSPAPDFLAGTYDGRVELVRVILEDIFGLPVGTGGPAEVPKPKPEVFRWALGQNAPNPCVTSTKIIFEVAQSSAVRLRVYNAAGQLVRVLADEFKSSGRYAVSWDGRDGVGRQVASGVYFYKLEASDYRATRKMLVVR
ncbi:MAG: FlgD immunoglobulin-like domain containing protein [bacterium]